MKAKKQELDDAMRAEYVFDYSTAKRGKYCKQLLAKGSNAVILDPDVAKVFHDSAAVNGALRSLLALIQSTERLRKQRASRSIKNAPRRAS